MQPLVRRLKNLFTRETAAPPDPVRGKWSIGIYTGASPIDVHPPAAVHNPVLTAADVTDVAANFVADPFMVRSGASWYMFFEVDTIRPEGNLGKIGLASSPDGFSWKYERIVLEAPFHLSYPYVFDWRGDIFMIPETRAVRSVRLYRAVDFPFTWRHEKTLLEGRRFADASIFRHHDRWWLFTDSGNTTLRLFGADDLDGRWVEHRQSPIVKRNPSIARPGGRVAVCEGHLFRYAQDCYPHYGNRVWAFRIGELTRRSYAEQKHPDPVLQASGEGWNRSGMHTIDAHRLEDGRWLACVDGFGDGGGR